MKPIKSTMKEKKRYFLINFKVENNKILDFKTKKNIILYYYKKTFGIIGLAKARLLFFEKENSNTNDIIVRINLKEQNNLRLTLLNIKEYYIKEKKQNEQKENKKEENEKKVIKLTAYTKKTSGILKKLKEN